MSCDLHVMGTGWKIRKCLHILFFYFGHFPRAQWLGTDSALSSVAGSATGGPWVSILIYYNIVENEILKIFSISSLVKISITWLFPTCFWAWNFTIFCLGLYNKQNITRWLEDIKIWLLSSRVKNNILLAALVRKILFSPLEDKSHIFAPPCNDIYACIKTSSIFNNTRSRVKSIKLSININATLTVWRCVQWRWTLFDNTWNYPYYLKVSESISQLKTGIKGEHTLSISAQ